MKWLDLLLAQKMAFGADMDLSHPSLSDEVNCLKIEIVTTRQDKLSPANIRIVKRIKQNTVTYVRGERKRMKMINRLSKVILHSNDQFRDGTLCIYYLLVGKVE